MTSDKDRGYFMRRLARETALAEEADQSEVAFVHRQFASRYAALAATGDEDVHAEPSAPIRTASS